MKMIHAGLIVAGAALAFGVAFAQEAEDGQTEGDGASEESTLEEVVVTGSRIFGQGQTASPLVQVTNEDFFDNPSVTISEFFADNITSNNVVSLGVDEGNTSGQAGTGNRAAGVSLWSLGEENTLTLLNGSRVIHYAAPNSGGWYTSDINSVLPAIAMARADVLLDGGGAIYGTDAVAGVINLVPRYGFEGIEFRMQTDLYPDSLSDTGSNAIEGIWGTGLGNGMGSFIAAFDHRITREIDALAVGRSNADTFPEWDGSLLLMDYQDMTGNANDGAAYESMTPSIGMGRNTIPGETLVDPLCGVDIEGLDYNYEGFLVPEDDSSVPGTAGTCHGYDFPHTTGRDTNRSSLFAAVRWDFSSRVSGSLDFGYSHRENWDNQQTSFDTGRGQNLSSAAIPNFVDETITADHPAWQYYMTLDDDWHRIGQPTVGMSRGMTVITPPPPLTVAIGPGIGYKDQQLQESDTYNLHGSLDIDLNETFGLQLGATYGRSEVTQNRYDLVIDRFENALAGLGGPDCDPATGMPGEGSCMFFNPFLSALLPNADTVFEGGSLANSPELIDYIYPGDALQRHFETDLLGVNALLSIDTGWELPGGEVLAVVGAEYRTESSAVDYNEFTKSADRNITFTATSSPQVPYSGDQTIAAVLMEAAVPVHENLSMQLAGRYDDYSTVGGTFNPKVGLTWNVSDRVALRTSYGTSFRAPTLAQTTPTQGRSSVPEIPGGGRRGGHGVTSIFRADSELGPQQAAHLSVGLDATLFQDVGSLNSLNWSASYVNIDFEDRIDVSSAINRNWGGSAGLSPCAFSTTSATGMAAWGGFYLTEDVDLDGVPDPDGQLCWDGSDPDGDGIIATREELSADYRLYTNLATTRMEGINLAVSSNWDTPFAALAVRVNATRTLSFLFQDTVAEPVSEVVGTNGIGGAANIANIREWTGNVRFNLNWRDNTFLRGQTTRLTLRADTDILNAVDLADGIETVTSGGVVTVDLRHQFAFSDAYSLSLTVRNLNGSERERSGAPLVGAGDRTYLLQFAYRPVGRGSVGGR